MTRGNTSVMKKTQYDRWGSHTALNVLNNMGELLFNLKPTRYHYATSQLKIPL